MKWMRQRQSAHPETRNIIKTTKNSRGIRRVTCQNQLKSGIYAIYAEHGIASSIKKTITLSRSMEDYKEFPPVKYFTRVLKNCPKSAFLYAQLWKKKGVYQKIVADRHYIREDFFVSPTIFRNLLSPLMCMNLIHVVEIDGQFQIDILGKTND